ncbi:MAG: OmpA family protein, partial [Bacteriovoracaceae bacterium]|nr:OmpA family protein [Bacteriovoracaceae bacterium]
LPGWMATFSDLVTLLLTFFVLLLSFAKTETAKYEAALGSLRNAFGGNVLKHGEVVQRGKSADNAPTILESQMIIKPFPIDFMTMEGILEKREINRESDEEYGQMKDDLKEFSLAESVHVYEMPEGIKVKVKDKIYFKKSSTKISKISIEVFDRMVKLLKGKGWTIFIEGHASRGETGKASADALELSSKRSMEVQRALVRRGVRPDKITTVFYGDNRPEKIEGRSDDELAKLSQRVEFIIRKTDLRTEGHLVDPM